MKFKKNMFIDYAYESSCLDKARLIKETGFDGVFIFADSKFDDYLSAARFYNLEVETIHLPFNKVCNSLWQDGIDGDNYTNDCIKWIERARKENIPYVIFHTSQNPQPEISEIGHKRFLKIVKAAEDNNIMLAVENLRNLEMMDDLTFLTNSKNVCNCFDCGHANAFTKNILVYDYEKYRDSLKCTHIHDNNGISDEHLPIGYGNIDYKLMMKNLKKIGYSGCLTLETITKVNELTETEFVRYGYKSLCLLEEYYNEE